MKLTGNTILITGGGSGIGRELALRFNDLGNMVIGAARRKEALQETIAGRDCVHAIAFDIEEPEGIRAFAKRVTNEHAALNVLINNAGIMHYEDLTRAGQLRDAEKTVVTNLLGPIRLTNALVDHLAVQPNADDRQCYLRSGVRAAQRRTNVQRYQGCTSLLHGVPA